MTNNTKIIIPCTVRMGGFNSEREFTIDLPGCKYTGLAFHPYVFESYGTVTRKTNPDHAVVEDVKDWVMGRVLKRLGGGLLLVNLPSGDNVELRAEDVRLENGDKWRTEV